jgi:glycosyltransferase involved in cell wall biosynthesis
MAAGIPAIVSSKVCEQINAVADRDVLISDSPGDVALQISKVLQNDALREEIGINGRRFIQANYSWDTFVPRLDEVLAAAVGGGPSSQTGDKPRGIPIVLPG